ncbi:poly-gamma-glutamate synthesis protein (capsule biosynthesis protein) [Halobiforma haloterrestris]|uniref:Poly-gamma-glutamate synthesis protein (Capsule biosynthesis protein) n=1 Tax=Natronobacterium haloterrestre TaxID=148448 RepID=A0A1I1HT90_NATHA|nr:CapA family protein [Halobiforma haloterrestris]SFC27025.1 poly-gamma-glutamate synthesis protein (capsule biosynthesis protein) [Halobiforma haloterrestris]
MTGSRRRFLAAAGAAVLGGCTAPAAGPIEFEAHERHGTTIGFVGDAMLGRDLEDRYGSGRADPASVWGDLRPRLQSLDGVCCNLECCLSTRGERFPDRTYYFRADPDWAVPALEAGNVRFASLANNHILDFGPTALRDTVDALADAGIGFAGAGERPAAARAPATVSIGDVDVAVVSLADHYAEYGATDDRPGTAYVETDPDVPDTRRLVSAALERARETEPDLLVASVHWGPNWVEYPDDDLRAFGHWLVDQGVDLVHGHSAHVVQGIERYGDGLVLHDTGDIVDDYVIKEDLRNDRTFLFELGLEDGSPAELRLVPAVIDDLTVSKADEDEAAWLRETMRDRSAPFGTEYERDGDTLVLPL